MKERGRQGALEASELGWPVQKDRQEERKAGISSRTNPWTKEGETIQLTDSPEGCDRVFPLTRT